MAGTPDEEFIVNQVNFSNGIADGMADKDWLPYSARFSRNLAIFDNLNYATLNPQPVKDSGSIVTDLVRWMDAGYPWDTNRYAFGNSGNVYKITSSNVWSVDQALGKTYFPGNGICCLGPNMFFAGNSWFAAKLNINTATPYWTQNPFNTEFGTSASDVLVQASGSSYTLPSTIIENTDNQLIFGGLTTGYDLFSYDPVSEMDFIITTQGSGNWTLTLHDQFNNNLGQATVTNANLGGFYGALIFNPAIRVSIGATYHVHLTDPTNSGAIQTSSSNNFSTAWIKTFYQYLIGTTIYHPMKQFNNGVSAIFCVGNDHYIGTYDLVTYNPNKIVLEPGFTVRSFEIINSYIVAYCTRGPSLTNFEEGRAYVWDGVNPYYLLALPLNMGQPNAIINFKQRLFGLFGLKGDFSIAPDESSFFRQIQNTPKLTKGYTQQTEPGAISVWQKRALFSFANTNDPNAGQYVDPSSGNHAAGDTYTPPLGLEPGVYEFGNQSDRDITYTAVSTEVLNFAYQPSQTIVNINNFSIGVIKAFGEDCYISYQDGTNYYVDRINFTNSPCSFGSWESLINDQAIDKFGQLKQLPQKKKVGVAVRVTFAALPTGCTVTAKYRLDRATPWIFGATKTSGETIATANLAGLKSLRYHEAEYGFDVTATTNYPQLTSVGLIFKPAPDETISGSSL
jgi:hypothetical protein